MKHFSLYLIALVSLLANSAMGKNNISDIEIKHHSDIAWEALNPARGANSPLAGNLWGDRKGKEASGFLVQFKDGFSSPPHIHNVNYRAIVIKGNIHNDDPSAQEMWMPPASFWTQPAGQVHITAAQGLENLAYVEIDSGPYLVMPIDQAFHNAEKPLNIDASNLIWWCASTTDLIKSKTDDTKIAALWQKEANKGYLLKLPNGFNGKLNIKGSSKAVVLDGQVVILAKDKSTELDTGSAFTAEHETSIKFNAKTGALIYFRTQGPFCIQSK